MFYIFLYRSVNLLSTFLLALNQLNSKNRIKILKTPTWKPDDSFEFIAI